MDSGHLTGDVRICIYLFTFNSSTSFDALKSPKSLHIFKLYPPMQPNGCARQVFIFDQTEMDNFFAEMHQLLQKYMGIPVTPHNTHQHHGSVPPPVTGHAPPTTTNVVHMPPPPPLSCWHSHTQGIAHKCAMQSLDSL